MHPQFWSQRWREHRIGFHRSDTNPHLVEGWPRLSLRPGTRVLVPLAGKSVDLLWLRDRGHEVVGVELVPQAVEAFFAEAGLEPERTRRGAFDVFETEHLTMLLGDVFDLRPEDVGEVHAVYDRAALIALAPDMRSRYASSIAALCQDAARGLLVTMEYTEGYMEGPPFSVGEAEVRELYDDAFEIELLVSSEPEPAEGRFADRGLESARELVFALTRRP